MSPLRLLKRLFADPALSRRRQFLRSLELFEGLSSTELGELAQILHARTYKPGEVVFAEGDVGRALFILESGSVALTRRGAGGAEEPLHTVQPGEFFGEMALLESQPRTATATAAETSRLHLLYRAKLETLLQSHPRVGVAVMGHLARLLSARLRRANAAAPK